MHRLTRKQRRMLVRILVAAVIFFPLMIIKETGLWDFGGSRTVELSCFLVPYFIIGYDVLWKAVRNVLHGAFFDECFLMFVATAGALVLGFIPGGEAENAEAVGVMLFYQVGELFQSVAVGKSRRSISSLMEIRPDSANLLLPNGATETVDPSEVPVGSTILVRPGERIPLDGTVLSGTSALDTAALTGESVPRDVSASDAVISGCINLSGVLTVRTEKEFGDSTVSRILSLVENASDYKAKSERFITRFAHFYTPAVVFAAILLAIIPPLCTDFRFVPWIVRALTFLIVSCPCALVISVPLSFFGGIGGAARHGILVKGSNQFEALASADTVVFDKTGTLTEGRFSVHAVYPKEGTDTETLLSIAAHTEHHSAHPIAVSIRAAFAGEIDPSRVSEITEVHGFGLTAKFDGEAVFVGNARFMVRCGIEESTLLASDTVLTVVHLAKRGEYLGAIVLGDTAKADAKDAIRKLRRQGVRSVVMLSGDRTAVAEEMGTALGIDRVYAELLPEEKVEKAEALLAAVPSGKTLAFVGDGINDAPVLARADVGIAMGALGSDAAIEAADVVLMDDNPSSVATAIKIARKTLRIVRQNVVLAIGLKVLVMILAAFGLASMWLAVFADVGVAVIAILNAMRTMK